MPKQKKGTYRPPSGATSSPDPSRVPKPGTAKAVPAKSTGSTQLRNAFIGEHKDSTTGKSRDLYRAGMGVEGVLRHKELKIKEGRATAEDSAFVKRLRRNK
jgi:hypothetical protein